MSSDGDIFVANSQAVQCSGVIRSFLGSMPQGDDILPLPNVNSAILRKVLQWAHFHNDDQAPAKDVHISSWDANFLKLDKSTLHELTMAACYLDIKGLLDVTSKIIAIMATAEICEMFKINIDISTATEQSVRKLRNGKIVHAFP